MSNLIQKLQAGSESRSILIIDDDIELGESLGRIFKMFFKECVIAKDGEEGLKKFQEYLEIGKTFTMVLTDLELPKKGGLTLIKEIRELTPNEPVMIISAHDEAEFMSEAISLEVQAYLLKPLAMPKLLENLEKILLKTYSDCSENNHIDRVTNLPLLSRLETFLEFSAEDKDILLRIKINHLANIYNLIGDEYADQYLKELCTLLQNLILDEEIHFYRISKDELALVLKDKEIAYANILAKDMVLLAKYFHISENGIIMNSTLSIGIAQGKENLLKYSRLALERSKSLENVNISLYTQSDYQRNLTIANGQSVMKMIFNAVENNKITPYVQPSFDIKTKNIEFFNTYVRIVKDRKVYEPEKFLTIAQNAHQLSMITRAMIKGSFAIKRRLYPSDALMVIYLADEDIYDESLLQYILFWANRYNIDPSKVGFEISALAQRDFCQKEFSLMHELKKLGYKIIIKQVGFDTCNLYAAVDLKPDYIKLHTDLIKITKENFQAIANMQKIVEIVHLIGAAAVVTKISNKEQLALVKSIGVDIVQGYELCYPYEVKDNE